MTLETTAALQDIRLRVLNNERVTPAEMRQLLDDLRRDRDNAARASASAKREAKKALKPAALKFDLDTLFHAYPVFTHDG